MHLKDKKNKVALNLQISFALDMMMAESRHWPPGGGHAESSNTPRSLPDTSLYTLEA